MSEVMPVFTPGHDVSFAYAADAMSGSPLKLGDADYSVTPATAATDLVIGQAEQDVTSGQLAHVGLTVGHGIRRYTTDAVIPVGAFVAPAGDGKVATATSAPAIGLVVKASTDTDHEVHVLVGVPYTTGA